MGELQRLAQDNSINNVNTHRNKLLFNQSERWRRIVMNDLENIPLGLIILWASPICNTNTAVTAICSVMFMMARVAHTLLYAYSIQPFRSIAFGIASTSILAAAINLVIGS